jgi:hypothetical protein
MKTLEQFENEQAAELAEKRSEFMAQQSIAEAIPATMGLPDRIQLTSGYLGAAWLVYEVDGLRSAIDLFSKAPVVPCLYIKDGCVYLVPEELISMAGKNMAPEQVERMLDKQEGDYAARLRVHQGRGFGPSVSLKWFIRLTDGRIADVHADVKGPDYLGNYSKLGANILETYKVRSETRIRRYGSNALASRYADRTIHYASGRDGLDETSADLAYLFAADTVDGTEHAHAREMLTHLADEVEPC